MAYTNESRPYGTASGSLAAAISVPRGGVESQDLTPFENAQVRIIRDVWMESQALYWERRAETLEWCRPRPNDYTGRATPQEIAARDQRLALTAEQCRVHARVLRGEPR